MKNFGKILAIVVALSMMLSVVGFAGFTDVKDTDSAYEAITVLNGLGIITGDTDSAGKAQFRPTDPIKRSEFAAVVDRAKALGDSADAAKGATMFTDVPAVHWASGFINLAAQQGIINGMGDGTFAPDANVTFAQSVKMIVCALGYEPQAKTLGGWPSGYLAVAAQKNITKGVASSKETEPATRATVAKLLYNALEVPLMEQTGFGTDIKFEPGDKLLLDGLDVIKVEGVVTSTAYSATTGLTTTAAIDKVGFTATKQVKAYDGKVYNVTAGSTGTPSADISAGKTDILVGNTNAKDLLEYSCVAYIKSIDDNPVFAAIAPKTGKNTTLVVKSDDIRFEEGTLATTTNLSTDTWDLVYFTDKDNNKSETVTIDSAASYYYCGSKGSNSRSSINTTGKSVQAILFEALAKTTSAKLDGTVTLLNNDNDDNYDVVFIDETKDFVVDDVYPKTYKITDTKYSGKSVIFDPTVKNYDFKFVKDGVAAKFEDIKKDDVLSIIGYINGNRELEFGTVIITSGKVTGKVNELYETDSKVTIGDKTYKYLPNVTVKIGDEGSYYANSNGKLIAVDTTQTSLNAKLAFVTKIAKTDGVSSSVQIRALTTAGEWKTFNTADKITYNGVSGTKTTDVWTSSTPYIVNKMVSYDVNTEGAITKYNDTPTTSNSDSFYVKNITGATYSASSERLYGSDNSTYVTSNTILINLPDGSYGSATEISESDISVSKSDSLADEFGYGALKVFNATSDNNEAPVVVGYKFSGVVKYNTNFMVVDTISSVLVDGDTVTKVSGYLKGEKTDVIVDNDTAIFAYNFATSTESSASATLIKKGAVILFAKDSKGNADKIVILANASDSVTATNIKTATGNSAVIIGTVTESGKKNVFILGYAYSLSNGNYRFAVGPASTDYSAEYKFETTASVYQYDGTFNATDGKVKTADAGDIETDNDKSDATLDGDYVFARVNDNEKIADAVIIKHKVK